MLRVVLAYQIRKKIVLNVCKSEYPSISRDSNHKEKLYGGICWHHHLTVREVLKVRIYSTVRATLCCPNFAFTHHLQSLNLWWSTLWLKSSSATPLSRFVHAIFSTVFIIIIIIIDPSLNNLACLARLKNYDTTKLSVNDNIYVSPTL